MGGQILYRGSSIHLLETDYKHMNPSETDCKHMNGEGAFKNVKAMVSRAHLKKGNRN